LPFWGFTYQSQGRKLWQKICQVQKAFALNDAIFLQIIVGRMKMGPGIVNPVPAIVKKVATVIK
jgi:hypothetical protein